MQIIKYIGLVFIGSGLLTALLTFISAKKNGTFAAVKELRRIRSEGYTKEHKEEKREDIYRRDIAIDRTKSQSRRARRVLERMEQAEAMNVKKPASAPGTSILEEVSGRQARRLPEEKPSDEPAKTIGEATDVLGKEGDSTDILIKKEEGTAALSSAGEKTGVIDKKEEGTAILKEADEKTDVLKEREEGTAVLSKAEEQTAVLKEEPDGNVVSAASEEKTDVLTEREESTGILPASEEATDVLPPSSEEATGVLPPSEEATALLDEEREEGTAVLSDTEEKTAVLTERSM